MNIETEPLRDKRQIQALFTYLKGKSSRNYVMAKIQLNTALRISDVVKLKVNDFFHPSGKFRRYIIVKEKKTGKERHIAINATLKHIITSYTEENNLTYHDYLIPSQKKSVGHISTTQAHRIFQDAGQTLHFDKFNSHSLRKSWGYFAYKKTKNIALIMQVYGHTSVTQTLKYIGITQTDKDLLYNTIEF